MENGVTTTVLNTVTVGPTTSDEPITTTSTSTSVWPTGGAVPGVSNLVPTTILMTITANNRTAHNDRADHDTAAHYIPANSHGRWDHPNTDCYGLAYYYQPRRRLEHELSTYSRERRWNHDRGRCWHRDWSAWLYCYYRCYDRLFLAAPKAKRTGGDGGKIKQRKR